MAQKKGIAVINLFEMSANSIAAVNMLSVDGMKAIPDKADCVTGVLSEDSICDLLEE